MNDVVKQKHTSFLETLKNIGFNTFQDTFDASLNNQAGFYRIYMKLFWIDLVIYTPVLKIKLAQLPQIMPIVLCVRHDELCKNDPCLSLTDVLPERKRSENEEHNDQRLFLCVKVGIIIYIDWRRSWHRARTYGSESTRRN